MQEARPDLRVLVLNDGFKGNLNQSLGIAEAFHTADIRFLDVHLKGPSYSLPSRTGRYPLASKLLSLLCVLRLWRCGKFFLRCLLKEGDYIWEERFDIVISAGSVLSPVNLIISKNIKAVSVNIMVPSIIPLKLFDFAVIPYHDFLRLRDKNLKNLIVTMGAPNCITAEMLETKSAKIKPFLTLSEDKKVIGVLIGGDDQNYTISVRWADELFRGLKALKDKYSFIITTSRRTENKVVSFIREKIEEDSAFIYAEFPGYSESTFYPDILFVCDYILVTEDSINMVSEAVTSGRPVVILGVERKKKGKQLIFDKTIEKMEEKGYAEYLSMYKLNTLIEKINDIKDKKFICLNEADRCIQEILQSKK